MQEQIDNIAKLMTDFIQSQKEKLTTGKRNMCFFLKIYHYERSIRTS